MRIRTTTRPGASPHPMSMTTALASGVRSGHGGAPSPAIQVSTGPPAISSGRGTDPAPVATGTVPLAALRPVGTEGEEAPDGHHH